MGSYTNMGDISLSVAVWLAHDDYDHDHRPNHISATSLLKSIRQTVLSLRVEPDATPPDIEGFLASRMGSAIHDNIERAWVSNYQNSLKNLGVPQRVIDCIRVNPTDDELSDDVIPVYLEQRTERELDGFIISGKFDFIADGRVEDFKSTKVFTYMNKTKDEDYIMQGSIYRWLNPDKITQDTIAIQFIFTDWNPAQAKIQKDKGYPPRRVMKYELPLKSIAETEAWIKGRIALIKKYLAADDHEIPLCDDKELWRKPAIWKVYKDHDAKRALPKGTFENVYDAQVFAAEKNGIIKEISGSVGACRYCDAFSICKQKDIYIANGDLIVSG